MLLFRLPCSCLLCAMGCTSSLGLHADIILRTWIENIPGSGEKGFTLESPWVGLAAVHSLWAAFPGKAAHANSLIISFIFFLFSTSFWLFLQGLLLSMKFFSSGMWASVLLFLLLFVFFFIITMVPLQTIIFQGHLFCPTCIYAGQWVSNTQTGHLKMTSCMIINNYWVKGEVYQ